MSSPLQEGGNPLDYRIREATAHEREVIGRLYHAVWHETQASLQPASVAAYRNEEFFIQRIRGLSTPPLLAEGNNRFLGFSAWTDDYLGQLYVLPEGRSLGLGQALLKASESAIQEAGFARARLHCLVGNDTARRFYERHGWQVTETVLDQADTFEAPVQVKSWEMAKAFMRP